ncbi:hypothetical protein Tco_0768431 [Tanacetum coccineum]
MIVRSDSPQNMHFGRTAIAELGMIPPTMHSTVLYQSEIRPKEVEDLRKVGNCLRKKQYTTRACLKDCYSLSEIDWKVDSLFDFKIKCFLDACKGYHQIQMIKEDEHKTADDVPPDSARRPPLRARKVSTPNDT